MSDAYTKAPKLKPGQQWRLVQKFTYRDELGRLRQTVERKNLVDAKGLPVLNATKGKQRKTCIPTYFGPDGKKHDKRPAWWRPVLYRLPELIKARDEARAKGERLRVHLVEGEAKADLLHSWGLIATCSPGGANAWDPTLAAELQGCDLISLPDNDDEGRRFIDAVGRSIAGVANSHRVVELPGLGPSEDIKDWAKPGRGNTKEQFAELVEATGRDWTPWFPEQFEELIVLCVADVAMEPIDWIWPGRIARGKLTCIAGHPGVSKSMAVIDIVARITNPAIGRWPCNEGLAPHGSVVILTSEDAIADTVHPRLAAAGADTTRVHVVKGLRKRDGKRRGFNLNVDIPLLDGAVASIGDVVLIVIDTMSSYMGKSDKLDTYKDTDIRALLEPLQEMAERHHVGVIGIGHLTKSGSNEALMRFLGSIGMVGAGRAAFLIVRDPNEKHRRLFLPCKNNLGPDDEGLAYRIGPKPTGSPDVPTMWAVTWENERVNISANEALAASDTGTDGRRSENAETAKRIILEMMHESKRVKAKDVERRLKELGISEQSKRTAKKSLGVLSQKNGKDDWDWVLPGQEDMPF